MSSRRPQIAKQNRTAGEPALGLQKCRKLESMTLKMMRRLSEDYEWGVGGPGLRPAPRRGRGLAKRGEAQGVAGTHDTKCCVPTGEMEALPYITFFDKKGVAGGMAKRMSPDMRDGSPTPK
jgi:hypothetical protein